MASVATSAHAAELCKEAAGKAAYALESINNESSAVLVSSIASAREPRVSNMEVYNVVVKSQIHFTQSKYKVVIWTNTDKSDCEVRSVVKKD